MGLREHLGLGAPPRQAARPFPGLELDTWFGKPAVGPSEDLNRIIGLPRRDIASAHSRQDLDNLEARYRLAPHEVRCACKTFSPPRDCPVSMRTDQGHALLEAERHGGLFAAMGVGKGKTLVDMLLAWVMKSKVAVLLLPAALVSKFLELDWRYYGGHWKLPNLAGGGTAGQWFVPGRPVLHVMSYEKLSRQEGTDLLMRIKPDLLILDEAHKAKNPKGPRRLRIQRCIDALKPRVAVLSGTIASRGIADAAHLADWALGAGSPYPRHHGTVEQWGTALDPIVNEDDPAAPPGALERLCDPGEHVRDGFRRRRNETPGVVATTSSSFEGSILIRRRMPGPVPERVLELIAKAHRGVRPDGEESKEQLMGVMWARQIACGFFHRWRFPRGEPEELIKRWKDARREWHREIRKKLEHPAEHMDTPGLLENAARRFYLPDHPDRLLSPDEKINKRATRREGLPLWKAQTFLAWNEIADQVQPVPSLVWLDKGCPEVEPIAGADFLVNDAVAWAKDKEGPGIVWVEFPELGHRIAKAAGIPFYGEGKEAGTAIQAEKGDRSILASMHAHRDGKDLQFAFWRNFFTSPFADGGHWEQAIGRTHRPGQKADTVIVDIAQHVEDFESSFAKARERSRFIQQTDGQLQKLLLADYEW